MISQFDHEQQQDAWRQFTDHQVILPTVNHLIQNSWKRCAPRVNPHQITQGGRLTPDHLLAAQVASFDLLSVARPVMEDIYQFIEGVQTAILLVNGAGFIIDLLGDFEVLSELRAMGIQIGALVSEPHMGTNAIGVALFERIPARVVGSEHFRAQYHHLADAAAPIFDVSGKLLGCIGLVTHVQNYQNHSLGICVAGARAIEGVHQADILLAEQNLHLTEIRSTLEAISDSILVWNAEGVLIQVNYAAARMFGVPANHLVGRKVTDIFTLPDYILEAVDRREPLTDIETSVRIQGQVFQCVVSLRYVLHHAQLQWGIIAFRQEHEVRRLVHRQVGAQAILSLDDIQGDSPAMRKVRRLVRTAAAAQASVFIRGETGTGKNVVASAIHNESTRKDGPFLIFSCSAMPNEVLINELVGEAESSNRTRLGGRPSKFELAHGGTLFFQDVENLPFEAQAVLLNFLELGIVQRGGSGRAIQADVRIVAASSSPMDRLIAQGGFRADLYYRLSPFEVVLPPLRQRRRDIPTLASYILRRLARQMSSSFSLGPGVIEALQHYPWPGNVRELEAVLGRAATQTPTGEPIRLAYLPDFVRSPGRLKLAKMDGSPILTLDEVERDTLIRMAEACNGNVTQIAQALKIGRTTVWRKLKKYQVSPEEYRK